MHSGAAVMRTLVRCMILTARRRAFPGETRARAGKRDYAGQNGAEKREKDYRLIHAPQPFIKLMSSTAIDPRLR